MKTHTHGNGRGLDDLYILPESDEERRQIQDYCKERQITCGSFVSDVEGQDWHGRLCLELPFGEGYEQVIRQHLEKTTA